MSTLNPREEEELRELVRRELQERDRLQEAGGADRRFRASMGDVSEDRRRIIDDEIARHYRSQANVRQWENEEGEMEWLTEEQIREREAQLPVDDEELEVGQQSMRRRVLIMSALFVFGVLLLFFILRDRTGAIQVVCNVQGASILLDGSPTALVTDAILSKIPTGPHLISLEKEGYVSEGPATIRVDVRPGQEAIAALQMKLHPLGTGLSTATDSLIANPVKKKSDR